MSDKLLMLLDCRNMTYTNRHPEEAGRPTWGSHEIATAASGLAMTGLSLYNHSNLVNPFKP